MSSAVCVCVCVFRVGLLVARQLTRLTARVLMPNLKKLESVSTVSCVDG
jgi:hypothetical protein